MRFSVYYNKSKLTDDESGYETISSGIELDDCSIDEWLRHMDNNCSEGEIQKSENNFTATVTTNSPVENRDYFEKNIELHYSYIATTTVEKELSTLIKQLRDYRISLNYKLII